MNANAQRWSAFLGLRLCISGFAGTEDVSIVTGTEELNIVTGTEDLGIWLRDNDGCCYSNTNAQLWSAFFSSSP